VALMEKGKSVLFPGERGKREKFSRKVGPYCNAAAAGKRKKKHLLIWKERGGGPVYPHGQRRRCDVSEKKLNRHQRKKKGPDTIKRGETVGPLWNRLGQKAAVSEKGKTGGHQKEKSRNCEKREDRPQLFSQEIGL